MNESGSLLFIYAETSLHAGSGIAVGTVDLPIQRERMSGLPIVQGSGLKGALRETLRERWRNKGNEKWRRELEHLWLTLFGHEPPIPGEQDGHVREFFAGAMSLTDARLLLLPVRTVRGGFAWVTSPMVLDRLARDWMMTEPRVTEIPAFAALNPEEGHALVPPGSSVVTAGSLLLEDLDYSAQETGDVAKLAKWFEENALPQTPEFSPFRNRLSHQLAILHDTDFAFLAEHATEVVTRVRIDHETGTVDSGALWTEESLPAETLLYSLVFVSHGRRPPKPRKQESDKEREQEPPRQAYLAADLVEHLEAEIGDGTRTRLGGDRTIGRGLVSLRLLPGGTSP